MQRKYSKRNLFASAAAFLTVGLMALFFHLYEPWIPVGGELIADPGFETAAAANPWSGWSPQNRLLEDGGLNGAPGAVLTAASNRNEALRLTIFDLENIPAFRVSILARASGIVPGKEIYHVPRALFFYQDADAKGLFRLRHGVMKISRDTGWQHYTRFFPVPQNAVHARLYIQNLGAAGTLQIDRVSVIPVRASPAARWWNLFFGVLWGAVFGFCLFVLHPWSRRYGRLVLLTAGVIITASVVPGEPFNDVLRRGGHYAGELARRTATPSARPAETTAARPEKKPAVSGAPAVRPEEPPIRRPGMTGVDHAHWTGHLVLFGVLAFLSALTWLPPSPSVRQTAALTGGLLLFAAATETLQLITPDRSAGWSDLLTDTLGILGALLAAFLFRFFTGARKNFFTAVKGARIL